MSAAIAPADFIHRFIPAAAEGLKPLLLLHGTGGNEDDLLPVADAVGPGRAVLSPRGKVLEGGMPRFFRRFAEGKFDEDDVIARAHELADFVAQSKARYNIDTPVAVGFSNGANIAAAMLLLRPEALAGAVLIRVMTPLYRTRSEAKLDGKPILMLSGAMDPIVQQSDAANLAAQFRAAGAALSHQVLPAGHGLTRLDMTMAKDFLDSIG